MTPPVNQHITHSVVVPLSDVLRVLRRGRRRLAPPAAVALALRVLDALDRTAHDGARGDVSPETVRLEPQGGVRLEAVAMPSDRALRYLAPEQARRHPIDVHTDLYAVGALLWEMLTGTTLVRGSTQREILDQVARATVPPPPSQLAPEAPRALDAVVQTLLAPEPTQRPKTISEAKHRLIAAMPDALKVVDAELASLADSALAESLGAPALLPPTPAPLLEPASARHDARAMLDALTLAHAEGATPTPEPLGRDASQVRVLQRRQRDARIIALFAVSSLVVAVVLAFLLLRP